MRGSSPCSCSSLLPGSEQRLMYLCQLPWRQSVGSQCIADLRALAATLKRSGARQRTGESGSLGFRRAPNLVAPLASSASGLGADNPDKKDSKSSRTTGGGRTGRKVNLRAAGLIAALTGVGTLALVSFTLANGGPAALADAISRSGFLAAFALIFVSEIGDKTFFIAALLAMRHSRGLVLLGSTGALAVMTVISVVMGRLFKQVPAQLQTTLPLGEYAAVILLVIFGLKAIKDAWELPTTPAGDEASVTESGELAEAEDVVKQAVAAKKLSTPMAVVTESFSLVFLAEWGDRSMLATVALGAAQSPWGVASGAILAHILATSLAIVGGAFLAQYISEKLVGYVGGFLFLVFAAATLLGAF